jgi:SAM-dependent methyltransferase
MGSEEFGKVQMTSLRRFINLNIKLSRQFTIRNMLEYGPNVEYFRLAALLFSAPDVRRVMDIAAGSQWQFPNAYKTAYELELSGVDIDTNAINRNLALDFRFIDDVCTSSKIGSGKYDLLTCNAGIEHFHDVQKFLDNAFSALRPGGAFIAQFPSRLAPFAILNRILPQNTKKKVLEALSPFPSGADGLGYPAFYDKCSYTEFKSAAERAGFKVEYYLPSYMSSGYFEGIFPLFLLSQLIDLVRLTAATWDMASYNLFVLRRPGDYFLIRWTW